MAVDCESGNQLTVHFRGRIILFTIFPFIASPTHHLLDHHHDHLHHHHAGDPHLCAQAAWGLGCEYFCWVPTTCLSWWLWWWPDDVMMILILIMIIFPQPVSSDDDFDNSDDDVIDECESGWVEECESSIQRRGLGEEIFWGWSCQQMKSPNLLRRQCAKTFLLPKKMHSWSWIY